MPDIRINFPPKIKKYKNAQKKLANVTFKNPEVGLRTNRLDLRKVILISYLSLVLIQETDFPLAFTQEGKYQE